MFKTLSRGIEDRKMTQIELLEKNYDVRTKIHR